MTSPAPDPVDWSQAEAGRELDAEVARRVMRNRPAGLPYSTSIAHAWLIVEKLRLTVTPSGNEWCAFHSNATTSGGGNRYVGTTNHQIWIFANTAPLAICRAALQAVTRPAAASADASGEA